MTKVKSSNGKQIELQEGWIFNRRVAALIVGALAFVVAFGINSTAQAYFREHVDELDRSEAWLIYTLFFLIIAIITINILWRYLI